MAQYELILPKMGESVAEATIIRWEKNPGDNIDVDDTVLEVATDKVDSEVPSPVKGKLVKHFFSVDDVAQVGDVIAIIETDEPEAENTAPDEIAKPEDAVVEEENEEIPCVPQDEAEPDQQPEVINNDTQESTKFYSPLVKSIAQEEGVSLQELDNIEGTGAEGRVTKSDLLDYINSKKPAVKSEDLVAANQQQKEVTIPFSAPASEPEYADRNNDEPEEDTNSSKASTGNSEILEMDRMRRLIADHMISSKQISAHVTSFVEADDTNLVQWRNKIKNSFEKREQEKITFTPMSIEAVAKAIKDMPMINISVNGTQIIKKKDINIGMATALPSGNLVVPVIKNADQLNMVGLSKSVNDLAARARGNKLKPDEVQGGTFTITNIGGFGNIMGTPIINQPQVAILAIGVIKKKPAVIETEHGDMIGIRHMMYLSMSYDHRVVDGALGGMFIRKVADYLEQWDVNREI